MRSGNSNNSSQSSQQAASEIEKPRKNKIKKQDSEENEAYLKLKAQSLKERRLTYKFQINLSIQMLNPKKSL